MSRDATLYHLLTWTSPGYPTGAFSYSHGLEWAVEQGSVRDVDGLVDFVDALLTRGSAWIDAVLFVHAWRATSDGDDAALDACSELAAAFRGSSETALEARQQGTAFLQVTCRAWPHKRLDDFAQRHASHPIAHSVALAVACALHEVPIEPGVQSLLHGTTANLVSAGLRLVPLGQTDGQIAMARLAPVVARTAARALHTDIDDLGTAAPGLEFCSIFHESQYTRLFRS
jgi:urease accessory protein